MTTTRPSGSFTLAPGARAGVRGLSFVDGFPPARRHPFPPGGANTIQVNVNWLTISG